ncbi:MAG TPA: hypothetical protein VNP04_27210 [Alphaproteobacteria bacterium]|nr:hypothetical protein [Alphaproteobacteria bacterium]
MALAAQQGGAGSGGAVEQLRAMAARYWAGKRFNDKSSFPASAGYTLANWEVLKRDLQQLIRAYDVFHLEASPCGITYEVRGPLIGPNRRTLHVVTIWIALEATGEIRFVTLFPDREVRPRED